MRRALIFSAGLLVSVSVHGAIPSSERQALVAIHQSTRGSGWTDDTNWLGAEGTECTWAGVRCNEGQTTVTGIFLAANNLDGPLPPEIGNLTGLTDLEMYENRISGALESQIGSLAGLKRLLLFDNEISGSLPETIGNLTALESLFLDRNVLSGPLPSTIGGMSSLKTLSINGNELNGPLPPSIGQLQNLEYLDFSYNLLDGPLPTTLGLLTNLVYLNLTSNQITGALPTEIGGMARLESLHLSLNGLTGPLPATIGGMQNLVTLQIHANSLSGSIPPELGQLPRIDNLTLSQNQLSGPIPPEIGSLATLRELWLQQNALSGAIPVALTNLENLERLQLEGNQLTGTIPPEIGRLSNLLVLGLGGNRLSGPIPRELGELRKLVALGLDSMDLSGPVPAELAQLTELVELVLFDNELTGTIPAGIGNLTKLQYLAFGGNRMTGTIPSGITNLSSLYFLDLRGNRFTGAIPPDIGRLTALSYLAMVGNELTGPIPAGIGDLANLETLRLDYNSLSGAVPSSLGNLTNLTTLLLSYNRLEGPLPPSIFDLDSLETLGLAGNRFDGPLPPGLTGMSNLAFLDISNNGFGGEIPTAITGMTGLAGFGSDFGFNAIYTSSGPIRNFMNSKQWDGDFEATQTVAPSGVAVQEVTDRTAVVTWSTIRYDDDEGGYEVTATPLSGSEPVIATTNYKIHDSILLRGLAGATQYRVAVRTVTHPHGLQQSTLRSDSSAEVVFTTAPRVVAPAMVDAVSLPSGLIQVGGLAQNQTSYALTNFGDIATTITIGSEGDPVFTQTPSDFTLGAGESRVITIESISQPEGSYLGYSVPAGEGVVDGLSVPVHLLSAASPSGSAVGEAVTTRVDISGSKTEDGLGTAVFRNRGTAPLLGILVSDAAWIGVPSTPVMIAPDGEAGVSFSVLRSRRPDAALADGTLSGTIRLVYLDGSQQGLSTRDLTASNGSSGVSSTLVTVVDTTKPPVGTGAIPPLEPGEVARFIAGFGGGGPTAGDLSITNAFGAAPLSDLSLYFTAAGSGTTRQASLGTLAPNQSLALANVVDSVYDSVQEGSLQIRSRSWDRFLVSAIATSIADGGHLIEQRPIFRSDRGARAGSFLTLAGVRNDARYVTEILIQEVIGGVGFVDVEFRSLAGEILGTRGTDEIEPFGLLSIASPEIPAGTTGVVVRNVEGSSGAIAAMATVDDGAGHDPWIVSDWQYVNGYSTGVASRILLARSGGGEGGGAGRRRPVRKPSTGTSSIELDDPSLRTEVALMNPGADPVIAELRYLSGGGESVRAIEIAVGATVVLEDAVSFVRGRSGASTGSLVIDSSDARLGVSARLVSQNAEDETLSTVLPVVAATSGLRRGQSRTFAGLEDSTRATQERETPGTFRTGFGIVETEGAAVRIRVSVHPFTGGSLVGAVLRREWTVDPNSVLLVDELLREIAGPNRETLFGDLKNLQVEIRVVDGEGAAAPFVVTTENATGDALVRLE